MRRFTKDEQELIRHLYYDLEYSTTMVRDTLKSDMKTIHYWVKKFGIPRNRSEAQFVAIKYGRKFNPLREQSHFWKGGKFINHFGYKCILLKPNDPFFCIAKTPYHPQGAYILEHRLIMAQYLNRPLTKDEIIHHLNGIRLDNRIQNLAIVVRSNHPTKTLTQLLKKRIRELEAEISQQKLPLS